MGIIGAMRVYKNTLKLIPFGDYSTTVADINYICQTCINYEVSVVTQYLQVMSHALQGSLIYTYQLFVSFKLTLAVTAVVQFKYL